MRLKADIGQAFVLDLNSVLARTFTERPIDGRTPNSKCLCDGRRADALLLERPIPSVFAMADGPMPSCLSALTRHLRAL
jgi:hypothetical protein